MCLGVGVIIHIVNIILYKVQRMAVAIAKRILQYYYRSELVPDDEHCTFLVEDGASPQGRFVKEDVLTAAREASLEYYEVVALMFLLTDDMKSTFKELEECDGHLEVFSDWLEQQAGTDWEDKLVEALCIIQNRQMLEMLDVNVEEEVERHNPGNIDVSTCVIHVRKALYLLCENDPDSVQDLVTRIRCQEVSECKLSVEFLELYFMDWAAVGFISLGDSLGQGVDIKNLLTCVESMDFPVLRVLLMFVEETSTLDTDGNMDEAQPNCSSRSEIIKLNLPADSRPCDHNYKVDANNVGVCLIINQKEFYMERDKRCYSLLMKGLENRIGTDVDRDRLFEVFLAMGFTVIVRNNLKHNEIPLTLHKVLANDVKPEHSCFVLCILSHGKERGIIYGSNSCAVFEEHLEEIIKKHKVLRGKPKIMFMQACQGDKFQKVVFANDMETDCATTASKKETFAESSDLMKYWSAGPGFTSLRDTISGTWLIEEMWRHFMSDRKDESILELLTRVNGGVSGRKMVKDGEMVTMCPQISDYTFRKSLVLRLQPWKKPEVAMRIFIRHMFYKLLWQFIAQIEQRECWEYLQ